MTPREERRDVREGPPPYERRVRLRQHERAAFREGAEEHSRATLGRDLTNDELKRVVRRFPGDQ